MGAFCARRREIQIDDTVVPHGQVSVAHAHALRKLRKKFAQQMKDIGEFRKKASYHTLHLPQLGKWTWLAFRKLKAREFHENQMVLTTIRRSTQAEM